MHFIHKHNNIYAFHDYRLPAELMEFGDHVGTEYRHTLYADFVFKLSDKGAQGRVTKDRMGIFNQDTLIPTSVFLTAVGAAEKYWNNED
jgi:hypothetical protein